MGEPRGWIGVPTIVDYETVLERMAAQAFVCHYYNSGAFGFAKGVRTRIVGWIGPDDPTIRAEARHLTRAIPQPYEANLAKRATRFWQEETPGIAWIMPKSHWAHDLDFGKRGWMAELLEQIAIDPRLLAQRANASAIEFAPAEGAILHEFIEQLLSRLDGSDFMLAFPGRAVLCTVHHHKQLWWMSTDERLANRLEAMASG